MEENYNSLKIQELKLLLSDRGLPTTGRKLDLIERLKNYKEQNPENTLNHQTMYTLADRSPKASSTPAQISYLKNINGHQTTEPSIIEKTPANNTNIKDNSFSEDNSSYEKPSKETNENAKMEARQRRFGPTTEEDKQNERAKRFNISTPSLEKEKQESRLKRFSLGSQSLDHDSQNYDSKEEDSKRQKRLSRFGIVDEDQKLRQRAERFGLVDDIEKFQQREERFKIM